MSCPRSKSSVLSELIRRSDRDRSRDCAAHRLCECSPRRGRFPPGVQKAQLRMRNRETWIDLEGAFEQRDRRRRADCAMRSGVRLQRVERGRGVMDSSSGVECCSTIAGDSPTRLLNWAARVLRIASVYAQQETVKMAFSGNGAPSTITYKYRAQAPTTRMSKGTVLWARSRFEMSRRSQPLLLRSRPRLAPAQLRFIPKGWPGRAYFAFRMEIY